MAASVPEYLLLKAGYVFPEQSDINLQHEIDRFAISTPLKVKSEDIPRSNIPVKSTNTLGTESFVGASVEARLYAPTAIKKLGGAALEVAQYVRDSVWDNTEQQNFLAYFGWNPLDFAASIAQTVQQAAEAKT